MRVAGSAINLAVALALLGLTPRSFAQGMPEDAAAEVYVGRRLCLSSMEVPITISSTSFPATRTPATTSSSPDSQARTVSRCWMIQLKRT